MVRRVVSGGLHRGRTGHADDRQGGDRRSHRPGRQGGDRPVGGAPGGPRRDRDRPGPAPARPPRGRRHGRRDPAPQRPVPPPATPRRRLPRAMAVRSAAVAGHQRHRHHPPVQRFRGHLPAHHQPRGAGHLRPARQPVLAVGPRRRGLRRTRPGPVHPVRAPVHPHGPTDPGPDRRHDDGDRGGGQGHRGHQVVRPGPLRLRPLRPARAGVVRLADGPHRHPHQVRVAAGDRPQPHPHRHVADRGPRRRLRRHHPRWSLRLRLLRAHPRLPPRGAGLDPGHGPGGDDRGRPGVRRARHPAGDRRPAGGGPCHGDGRSHPVRGRPLLVPRVRTGGPGRRRPRHRTG